MSQLELKDRGMSLAAQANKPYLDLARKIALKIGQETGQCSIEDIRANWPYDHFPSGNWCGAIFRDFHWSYAGTVPALHNGGHCRRVGLWQFTPHAKNPVEGAPSVVSFPSPAKKTTHGELNIGDKYDQHGQLI